MRSFTKIKRVKLKGKAIAELNKEIHERDSHKCIYCGEYVDIGEKFHHVRHGADKTDIIENGVLLCYQCHQEAHFTNPKKMLNYCLEYLDSIYK